MSYRQYLVIVVAMGYCWSFVDRVLVGLFAQPLKDDLHLSDVQLGLLTGIAFGLFYATLGIPIARWGDRGNRPLILGLALVVWGAAVMSTSLVVTFAQLMLMRVLAGIGDAACYPVGYSLIGAHFKGSVERTRALTWMVLCPSVATLISFIGGGYLEQHFGWRRTMMVAALPGLVIALLMFLTLKEPRSVAEACSVTTDTSAKTAILVFLRRPAARHFTIASILLMTFCQGMNAWYAPFMMRSHSMTAAQIGLWLGLIFGISGIVGILLGGRVAAHFFKSDESAQIRASAIAAILLVPLSALFLLLSNVHYALLALIAFVFVAQLFLGVTASVLLQLLPNGVHATGIAIYNMATQFIALGAGPELVGALSDAWRKALGVNSLRYALLSTSFVALIGAWQAWVAAKTANEDVRLAAELEL